MDIKKKKLNSAIIYPAFGIMIMIYNSFIVMMNFNFFSVNLGRKVEYYSPFVTKRIKIILDLGLWFIWFTQHLGLWFTQHLGFFINVNILNCKNIERNKEREITRNWSIVVFFSKKIGKNRVSTIRPYTNFESNWNFINDSIIIYFSILKTNSNIWRFKKNKNDQGIIRSRYNDWLN